MHVSHLCSVDNNYIKDKKYIMKNSILALALFVSAITFANPTEDPIKKNRDKIVVGINYAWEVKTIYGFASGTSLTLAEAEKTVKLIATKDIVSSKIIETQSFLKNK